MHLTSCGTLVIFITGTGELLLYFIVIFFSFHIKKKYCRTVFGVVLCCLISTAGLHIQWGLNCDQMEEGEQYSEYPVERNPRAYMSMRDYRNQWMSSPYGSVYNHSWGNHTNSSWEPRPPQYAPPEPPYYAPTS